MGGKLEPVITSIVKLIISVMHSKQPIIQYGANVATDNNDLLFGGDGSDTIYGKGGDDKNGRWCWFGTCCMVNKATTLIWGRWQ